ncbi:hypothetical protein GQ457_07G042400 [Hibiscus cannabinus]
MDASSVAPGECSPYNWGYNISTEEMLYQIFDGGQQDFRSMAQTSYMESSMPVPQHLKNSHGALSSEPDPTHQDLALNEPLDKAAAGTPSMACKRKEPERNHKKREADRKYRADIKRELTQYRRMKPENDRLRQVVSRFGGIEQLESQISHMKSELHRLQQKEVDYHMTRQLFDTDLNRLEHIKSKYGGIHEMESMLDKFKELEANSKRLELMKSRHGGIEKMESMLDAFIPMEAESHKLNQIKSKLGVQETESILLKFKEMEDQLQRFNQIKSTFGGIEEIEPGINRLKKIELQLEKHKQTERQPFRASPHSPQEKSRSQLLDLNGDSDQVSYHCGINLNSSITECNTHYTDALVDRLMDEDDASKSDNSFNDLLSGAWERVNKFEVPPALVSTAGDIFKVHGDIAKDCKLGAVVSNTIFAFLCAAIKVMGDLSLDQVTEEVILKLRDPIMDAKRCKFDVEFALQHLKTITQAYFGLKALRDYNKLKHKLESLRTAEQALRKKLQEKSQEINATEARLRDLTSDKCRICQESAKRIMRN